MNDMNLNKKNSEYGYMDSAMRSISDTANSITNSFRNSASDVSSVVVDTSKEVVETLNDKVDDYMSNSTILIGFFLVVLLCLGVAYGLYFYISYSIFNKSKITIEETKTPVLANRMNKFPITTFNKTGNGKRRTITFWIYIYDMNKYSGSYKHVFHIGDSDDIRRASPYVFLDSHENRMYVRFGSSSNDSFQENISSIQSISVSQLNDFMVQGIEIPYIPLQRWVHIAVVVNENANGGSIIAYVDGDISKTVTTGDISNGSQLKIMNLDLDKMGDLYVGGSFESQSGPGFSGLISKVSLFNYDLNNKDIYEDYNRGPLSGFLTQYGLANYGIRSPVYKIV